MILKVGFIGLSLLHSSFNLTLGVFLRGGRSLIIELFALAQAYLDLHPAALEVDGQGNQGIAVLLDLAEEAHDFPLVEQKPPGALGVFVEDIAVVIGGDVHLVEDHLSVFDAAPAVLQVQGACPDGLDLGAQSSIPASSSSSTKYSW